MSHLLWLLKCACSNVLPNDALRKPECSALLLAFYFLKLCVEEVLKHEDSQSEVTSLEVRYRVAQALKIRLKIILKNFSVDAMKAELSEALHWNVLHHRRLQIAPVD